MLMQQSSSAWLGSIQHSKQNYLECRSKHQCGPQLSAQANAGANLTSLWKLGPCFCLSFPILARTNLQGVTNFDVQRIADIVEKGGVKVEANQVYQRKCKDEVAPCLLMLMLHMLCNL